MWYWRYPLYRFEMAIGSGCNMRCKFCFEKDSGYKDRSLTYDQLDWWAGYMKHMHDKSGVAIQSGIYGGEPLLYMDKVLYHAETIAPFAKVLMLSSNGLLVQKYAAELKELYRMFDTFYVNVSYNYALQNETRQEGTYDAVRDAIRFLCSELGWHVTSTVVLTADTLHRVDEVFDDFYALYKETGGRNRVQINYNAGLAGWDLADEKAVREALSKVRGEMLKHPELLHGAFMYNWIGGKRGHRRCDCLFAFVRAALCADGSVMPGYDTLYSNEFTRDLLRLGTAGDDFVAVDKRIDYLIKNLHANPPAQCRSCASQCRLLPWRTMVDSADQYNVMPHPDRCRAIQMFYDYIPWGRDDKTYEQHLELEKNFSQSVKGGCHG